MARGLDFETFCELDLRKVGLDRYVSHPSFKVLIGCINTLSGSIDLDFVLQPAASVRVLQDHYNGEIIAHNAVFEQLCIEWLEREYEHEFSGQPSFIDSAVSSRVAGFSGSLDRTSAQALPRKKLATGAALIKLFSQPNKQNNGRPFTADELRADPQLMQQWLQFKEYCGVDSELSVLLDDMHPSTSTELTATRLTTDMNLVGWPVDLEAVRAMQSLYKKNLAALQSEFMATHGAINLNSYKQLQQFCADRGICAKSFDQLHLQKLKLQIEKKLKSMAPISLNGVYLSATDRQRLAYIEVLDLIEIKQQMGGSSLSKLQTILDTVGPDDRLRHQYIHAGAPQTLRTTGVGVQMQNLPRLGKQLGDIAELQLPDCDWDNAKLSENIRQVFRASHPDGELIVGDFKAIESRGLAWSAGENWKLKAYKDGLDVYRMLAMKFQANIGTPYDDITDEQRRGGKVGELACGYGAGDQAIADFAEKMGILMPVSEARTIKQDWRAANQHIVNYWDQLDGALHEVLRTQQMTNIKLPHGEILMHLVRAPMTLTAQDPQAAWTLHVTFTAPGSVIFVRKFHGVRIVGNDVRYYKPSSRKTGDLWDARMKTPPHAWYKLYGGKLAGILTQSLCREIFFSVGKNLSGYCNRMQNLTLIGQFHDEFVIEWTPGSNGPSAPILDTAIARIHELMSTSPLPAFPLDADVKHGHRYIK